EGALPERCRALAGTARAQLELEVPLRLLHADERRRDADGEPPVPQIAAAERESTGGRAPSAGPVPSQRGRVRHGHDEHPDPAVVRTVVDPPGHGLAVPGQAEVVIDRVQDEMEAGVGTDARAGDAVR